MATLENSVIFDKGELITNDYFIGNAYLKMLVPEDTIYNCPIGNVTFEPELEIIGINMMAGKSCLSPAEPATTKKKENQPSY